MEESSFVRQCRSSTEALQRVLPGLSRESPGEFFLLAELLDRDLFELIPPAKEGTPWRITYLMSDAAESFLLPEDPVLVGTYDPSLADTAQVSYTRAGDRSALVLRQEGQVSTLFFSGLALETHCYDYGDIGHFWLPGDELLRLIQFKAEILFDKETYLGERCCTDLERELALLYAFPPLSSLFFPAAPRKYLQVREKPFLPGEGAVRAAASFAEQAGDPVLARRIRAYGRHPSVPAACLLAKTFRQREHLGFQKTVLALFREAGSAWPERPFPEKIQSALDRRRKEAQAACGDPSAVFVEVPYLAAQDEITEPRAAAVLPGKAGRRAAFRISWFDGKDHG